MGENRPSDVDLEALNQDGSARRPRSLRDKFISKNTSENGSSLHRPVSRLSTVSEIISVRSERTRNSLRYLQIFPTKIPEQSPQPVATDEALVDQAKEEFMELVRGKRPLTDSLEDACRWYAGFLEANFQLVWAPLLRPCLTGIDASVSKPGDLGVVYKFMKAVAEQLMEKENMALVDVVDSLVNDGYLKDDEFSEEDGERELPEERALPNQLTFAALGWLSQLYKPKSFQEPGKLQISKNISTSKEATLLSSRLFTTFEQGFDYKDQPFYQLLRKFGDLIPEFKGEIRSALDWGTSNTQVNDNIEHAHVAFHTLINVAKVKIEWVDALSLHFHFDSRNRTLKLFRFPSFCRIMYSDREKTLLSMLFNDHLNAMNPQLRDESDHTGDFFKEVLLSYRLVFGQHKKSWKRFNKEIVGWNRDWDCSGEQGSKISDPMLHLLCGKSWLADGPRQIYDEILADEPLEYYIPNLDFPFLGKRILSLQVYVKSHNAHSLRALWHDHRNVGWWWTFWAVVFLGVITVLLAILSLVFSIWQVALAQESYALSKSQMNTS